MGQRANYIIKEGKKLTIHYNHWRANCIASDLFLGEKRFLEFVNDCQLKDEIIPEPWIEGCVIIDKTLRQLYFWEQFFPTETSVINYYLSQLSKKWEGWCIHMLKNRMYDAEMILEIDYTSKQELQELNVQSEDFIINDKIEEWDTAVVIIKNENNHHISRTGNIDAEHIISYGEGVISLLRDKPQFALPKEEESVTSECIIIDTFQRGIFINKSFFGLWEQSKALWEGYDLTMGDLGYIGTLELAGIDTSNIAMPHKEVVEQFEHMVKPRANYDPSVIVKKLTKENKDIQFNPDFFDNVHPKKTILEKVKIKLRKLFKR
jgi:hypothetical protein